MPELSPHSRPYSGFFKRTAPREDERLTHTGPGTPCGELMRRYWQPVALSSQLGDMPFKIRILGEELVLFRDRSGRVGLLHKHCCHRGASLEFGRIAEHGIRCCYHGWHFDIDGTVLDTPGEPPESRLKTLVSQGAYKVHEAHGIVFAYLGDPDAEPAFPDYDSFHLPGTELVPYALRHDCNWLQVHENLMDPLHAVFLHSRMGEIQLTAAWGEMPVVEWGEVGERMYYVATRRTGEHVWVRFNEVALPNFGQVGGFWQDGIEEVLFERVGATRWTVPIDDTHCWIFGLRHFSDALEAKGIGNKALVGLESLDIYGQSGDRPYDEMQRNPGDWEVEVSQGPIAIHARENRGTTDRGILMLRRQLGRAMDAPPAPVAPIEGIVPTWTSNTVVRLLLRNADGDRELLRRIGRAVVEAVMSGDRLAGEARQRHIVERLGALRTLV